MENHLSEKERERGLIDSIFDGVFANIFGTLTGGIFLISFALYIGANELEIGLIASLPLLANSAQPFSSYIIEKTRRRKELCLKAAGIARGIWVLIILALLFYPGQEALSRLIYYIILIIAISSILASVSAVSWLSWMSDLVSENIRGRYFSKRNIFCGIAGLIVTLIGGRFLDYWKIHYHGNLSNGFILIFLLALLSGIMSLGYIKRMPEPAFTVHRERPPFSKMISLTFQDENFKRYIFFTLIWSFSVHFVSPFFAVYMLQDLKLSYTFVAWLAVTSSLADILGMRLWGVLSDRFGNKPIISFNGYIASFVPFLWIFATAKTSGYLIFLHVLAGFFWAGINLCTSNLLLRISYREYKSVYISFYNAVSGVTAAVAPILGGMVALYTSQWGLKIFFVELKHLHFIFIISFLLRFLSITYFKNIKEPEEVPVSKMIRVLRSIRGLNTLMGFNHLHHSFIEAKKKFKNEK